MRLSRQLLKVASWRLVAELVRRYPGRFTVVETHPGGGQYDCLTILARAGDGPGRVDLNRDGQAHVHRPFGPGGRAGPWAVWEALAGAEDPKPVLDELGARAGLGSVSTPLPADTPETVAYRFIAAFLTHAAFGRRRWACRNGHHDSSGMEGSYTGGFDSFPHAADARRRSADLDPSGEAASRFWFLTDDRPRLCIEPRTGLAYDLAGSTHDLFGLYRRRRRIWPIVTRVAGDLLP